MANIFTKKDLKTGDIVVLRDGELGVVIVEKEVILFQNNGMDYLDEYEDDLLLNRELNVPECDIMQVLRGWYDSAISFLDPYDGEMVFERVDDIGFVEKKDRSKSLSKEADAEMPDGRTGTKRNYLEIISQAFYGNRTLTQLYPENMDRFILGYLDESLEVTEPIDRTIVHLPGSDKLVLVYNKFQEEEHRGMREEAFREHNYKMKPLAEIPELDLVLYSRCIALRMEEDGSFSSIEEEDGEILDKYLYI